MNDPPTENFNDFLKSNPILADIIGEKLFKEKYVCSQISNLPAL